MCRRTMSIANATATKDGETLVDTADISDTDLASLLDYADEIVIHEVHDQKWVDDRQSRYPREWDEKVTIDNE